MPMNCPTFSQWGRPWSDKQMAPTSLTLATHGCYITSVASMLHNFAFTDDPGQVLDKLIAVNGLNEQGLLTYDGLMRAYPEVYFYNRAYTFNDPSKHIQKTATEVAIEDVARLLYLGQPTILCVDNLFNDQIPDHAILATDVKRDLGKVTDFRIMDPDGGLDIWFTEKYGNIRDGIYGYVSIIGDAAWFPEVSDDKAGKALWKASQIKQGRNVDTYAKEIMDTLL